MTLATQFANKQDGAFDDANQSYKLLKDELAKYVTIAKNGGWQPVVADKKLYKKGTTSPAVVSLRKRLTVTGELNAGDSSNVYDTVLVEAIKTFQNSVGIKPDGTVSDALIKQLNVASAKKVRAKFNQPLIVCVGCLQTKVVITF